MKQIGLVLAAIVGVLAASCAGNSAIDTMGGGAPVDTAPVEDIQTDNGATGLSAVQGPRSVSGAASVVIEPGTRSYMTTTASYATIGGAGVFQEVPEFFVQFEAKSDELLPHTFFVFNTNENPEFKIASLALDIEWAAGASFEPGDGFYVGLPDYENNVWNWDGPITSVNDVLDFSNHVIVPHPVEWQFERIALVNFSGNGATLRSVNFTTVEDGDTAGDESVFYIKDNTEIKRLDLATEGDGVVIVSEGSGVEYANLYLLDDGYDALLLFDRRVSGGNWEVWQTGLDGSGLAKRHSGMGNVRVNGTTLDGGFEFITDSYSGMLNKVDSDTLESVLSVEIPGEFRSAPRWYLMRDTDDISLIVAGYNDEGLETLMSLLVDTRFEFNGYYQTTYHLVNGVTEPDDPFYLRWANGQFGFSELTLYSARKDEAATLNIHAHYLQQAATSNNKPFITDEMYDLRYPAASPDNRILGLVVCEPGQDSGSLVLQSALMRGVDTDMAVDSGISGPAVWFDPTPVPVPTR